jgi:hypothetical protein
MWNQFSELYGKEYLPILIGFIIPILFGSYFLNYFELGLFIIELYFPHFVNIWITKNDILFTMSPSNPVLLAFNI